MIIWVITGVWIGFKHLENKINGIDITLKECFIILISGIAGPLLCIGIYILKCGDRWDYFKLNLDKYKDK